MAPVADRLEYVVVATRAGEDPLQECFGLVEIGHGPSDGGPTPYV
jgi:hypothetical protein